MKDSVAVFNELGEIFWNNKKVIEPQTSVVDSIENSSCHGRAANESNKLKMQ